MVDWKKCFSEGPWPFEKDELFMAEALSITTLVELKSFLDMVHIRQALLRPFAECKDYPVVDTTGCPVFPSLYLIVLCCRSLKCSSTTSCTLWEIFWKWLRVHAVHWRKILLMRTYRPCRRDFPVTCMMNSANFFPARILQFWRCTRRFCPICWRWTGRMFLARMRSDSSNCPEYSPRCLPILTEN